MPLVKFTQAIKEHAYHLGFALVGVTTSELLPHADVFEAWLEQGRQGEMSYLATDRSRQCRGYPKQLLPECRSVLVLGAHHPAPPRAQVDRENQPGLRGKVAAYAWGVDYHKFLPERLETLVHFIESQVGHAIPHHGYTDTGPILERELAQRAGLGWIGKNTCLINPRAGSHFLLAEILLGIELEPDPPFVVDRCGTCTRCILACPTGCILPDRTLDARRCISYLTIELKGPIPLELRPRMNGWIFGCDICQQVCPWNSFARIKVDQIFNHQLVQPEPDLLSELTLSVVEFNRKYRSSPLRRAKQRGYHRNIAVALGNSFIPQAIKPLELLLLSSPEPLVRGHAAWGLGQIGSAAARKALFRARGTEIDEHVLHEIEYSLARFS